MNKIFGLMVKLALTGYIVSSGRHGASYGSSGGGSGSGSSRGDARSQQGQTLNQGSNQVAGGGIDPGDFNEAYQQRLQYLNAKYPGQSINEANVRAQLQQEYASGQVKNAQDAARNYTSNSLASREAQRAVLAEAVEKLHGQAMRDYSLPKEQREAQYAVQQAAIDERRMSEVDKLKADFTLRNQEGKRVEARGFEYEGRKYFGDAAAVKLMQLKAEGKAAYSIYDGGVEIRFNDRYSAYPDVVIGKPSQRTQEGIGMHDAEYRQAQKEIEAARAAADQKAGDFQRSILGVLNSPWIPGYNPRLPEDQVIKRQQGVEPLPGVNLFTSTTTTTTTSGRSPPSSNVMKMGLLPDLGGGVSDRLARIRDNFLGLDYEHSLSFAGSKDQYQQLDFLSKIAVSDKSGALRGVDQSYIKSVNDLADSYISQQRGADIKSALMFSQAKASAGGAQVFAPGYQPGIMMDGKKVSDAKAIDALQADYQKQSAKFYTDVEAWRTGSVKNAQNSAVDFLNIGGVRTPIPANLYTGGLVVAGTLTGLFAMGAGAAALASGQGVKGMMLRSTASTLGGVAGTEAFNRVGMPVLEAAYPYAVKASPLYMAARAAGAGKQFEEAADYVKPGVMLGAQLYAGYKIFGAAGRASGKFTDFVAGAPKTTVVSEPIMQVDKVQQRGVRLSDYTGEQPVRPEYFKLGTTNKGVVDVSNRLASTRFTGVDLEGNLRSIDSARGTKIYTGDMSVKGTRGSWLDTWNGRIANALDKVSGGRYGGYEAPSFKALYDVRGMVEPAGSERGYNMKVGNKIADYLYARGKQIDDVFYSWKEQPPSSDLGRSLPGQRMEGKINPFEGDKILTRSVTTMRNRGTGDIFTSFGKGKTTEIGKDLYRTFIEGFSSKGAGGAGFRAGSSIVDDAWRMDWDSAKMRLRRGESFTERSGATAAFKRAPSSFFDLFYSVKQPGAGAPKSARAETMGGRATVWKDLETGELFNNGAGSRPGNTDPFSFASMAKGGSGGGGRSAAMNANVFVGRNANANIFSMGFDQGAIFGNAFGNVMAAKPAYGYAQMMGVVDVFANPIKNRMANVDAFGFVNVMPGGVREEFKFKSDLMFAPGFTGKEANLFAEKYAFVSPFKSGLESMNRNAALNMNVMADVFAYPNEQGQKYQPAEEYKYPGENVFRYINDYKNLDKFDFMPFSFGVPPAPYGVPFDWLPLKSDIPQGGLFAEWDASAYRTEVRSMNFARWDEVLSALTGLAPKRFVKEINTLDDLIRVPSKKQKAGKGKKQKKGGGLKRVDFDSGLHYDSDAFDDLFGI